MMSTVVFCAFVVVVGGLVVNVAFSREEKRVKIVG